MHFTVHAGLPTEVPKPLLSLPHCSVPVYLQHCLKRHYSGSSCWCALGACSQLFTRMPLVLHVPEDVVPFKADVTLQLRKLLFRG